MNLPESNWVYFATPTKASSAETTRLVTHANLIIRSVYNTAGLPIANVQRLHPDDRILLAYGGDGQLYRPIFRCTIAFPDEPVETGRHLFKAFSYADESLTDHLYGIGYSPDPVLKKFVGISIAKADDLQDVDYWIQRPSGNNAIWRWGKVFPRASAETA